MTFEEERIRVSAVKSIYEGGLARKCELQPVSITDYCSNSQMIRFVTLFCVTSAGIHSGSYEW